VKDTLQVDIEILKSLAPLPIFRELPQSRNSFELTLEARYNERNKAESLNDCRFSSIVLSDNDRHGPEWNNVIFKSAKICQLDLSDHTKKLLALLPSVQPLLQPAELA